ncbi:type VI secretion protein IcmF/TssM N-terminal domain-containing protein, partial [Paraburkholderia dipogonis]
MKKLSFLVSRWFLAFLALLVLGLVIWFLGPFVAFGGLKPLVSVGMRVLVIALLLVGALLWLKGWSTGVVFGALLCLLVWYAGPLLSFGRAAPLTSVAARVVAIAVVLALFAAFGLYWLWQKMRSDEAFLKKALTFGGKKEAPPAAGRLKEVEARINAALARLKSMRTGARGAGRLFQGTRYLYELPWFIALGSTSSGKTSALLNAGLVFPIGGATPRTAGASVGTKNIDWWLSNDAVLIDTAGYYTRHGASTQSLPALADKRAENKDDKAAIQGADAAVGDADWRRRVDEDEWHGFLDLLRRHRPRAPINGAVLAISLDILTASDPAVRATEADMLRERLADLRARLGIRFPVYLMITQMDRLSGFADYFGSLTEEHRAQMW